MSTNAPIKKVPKARVVKGYLWAPVSFSTATRPELTQWTPRFYRTFHGETYTAEELRALKKRPDYVWVLIGS